MSLQMVPLASAIHEAKPGFASGDDLDEGIFQIRMNNITRDGGLDLTKKRRVRLERKKADGLLAGVGDVMFNATNSPDLVGKSAYIDSLSEPTTFSNHFIRLRTNPEKLDGNYLARWLHTQFQSGRFKGLCRQWVNQATVSRDALLGLEIPLPPLPEQRRIAAILDQADTLRAKRREALAQLDPLTQSIFIEMFGGPVANPKGWQTGMSLGDVADIVSGVTKGRKLKGQHTREVPYLAVANVQDMRLNLDVVKHIYATEEEISRYALEEGDLLLTEGGDPDKLGRGTLWHGNLPECIHQYHVFRVRLTSDKLTPYYLNWLVGSQRGKRYFFKSAKQTTGIASINMTQLRSFPILLPPIELQREFERTIDSIKNHWSRIASACVETHTLFSTLQHRAFRGEL